MIVSAVLRKRSRLPGVTITQFVTSIPDGKSTPDFQCKPAPATVEEGERHSSDHWFKFKNGFGHCKRTSLLGETAVFRVRVKGDPKPDVSWKRTKGAISENETFQTTYDKSTGEHVLQVGESTAKLLKAKLLQHSGHLLSCRATFADSQSLGSRSGHVQVFCGEQIRPGCLLSKINSGWRWAVQSVRFIFSL